MLSIGHRRMAAAFVTKLPGHLFGELSPRLGQGRGAPFYRLGSLQLARVAAKSTYTGKLQNLVIHGPPAFSPNQNWERPFKLVIVESPSKCQTISKILQEYVKDNGLDHDYVVTSCMGHIRNIPQQKSDKNQKVAGIDLEGGKYEPTYTILPEKEHLVKDLTKLASKSQQLILATDDDREGEAMAWHLLQVLSDPKSNTDPGQLPPLRVRFTEITPKAITESIFEHANTNLRENLVQAQETRRILDRLAGFTVSPILWKKIAPGLSAGRVQSVGMALIVRRERERLLFKESEYWAITAKFLGKAITFPANLVSVNGSPLVSGGSDFEPRESNKLTAESSHKFHLKEKDALELVSRFEDEEWTWTVANITESLRKLNPPAPYITSTMQQEAHNRLGLSVSQTMQTAQQLYEKGYISYMRTDSNHLSDDALAAMKTEIVQDYGGEEYYQVNTTQRSTKRKEKNKPNTQAAHEAIRPAIQQDGRFAKPETLPSEFGGAANELYQLIYQRTLASHMPPQVSRLTTIQIVGSSGKDDTTVLLRSAGSVIVSPGYTIVYPSQNKGDSSILPELTVHQEVYRKETDPIQHWTQPPARYTEASFVQELEALGVGRPSTYAGTVKILRDRAYAGSPVSGDGRSRRTNELSGPAIIAQRAAGGEDFRGSASGPMVPSLTAFAVCSLLEKYCNMYVDPSFTAKMEERLDQIANAKETFGDDQRILYLDEFYAGEDGLAAQIEKIEEQGDADDARRVYLPSLASDTDDVGLFVGPWGPYVRKVRSGGDEEGDDKPVTAQLPPGMASDLSSINLNALKGLLDMKEKNGLVLGHHPEDGRIIRLKVGRFGAFLQWGDDDEEGTTTHTLPSHLRKMKNMGAADSSGGFLALTFEEAVQYVNLPRTVCDMDGSPITAAIGPYGPYLKYNRTFVSLKASDGDVLTIDPETAVYLLKQSTEKKSTLGAGTLAEIGEKDGSKILVKRGRFGVYINWKKVNAKMPTEYLDVPSELPLEEAWGLIQEKLESTGSKAVSGVRKGKGTAAVETKGTGSVEMPPGPKRPLSSYLHFCAQMRGEVAKTAPSLGETSKELARLWSVTSTQERKQYQDLADQSKVAYEVQKAEWQKECQERLEKTGIPSPSSSRRVDTVKRPRSAYVYFCSSKRPEVAQKFSRLGDVSKELARMWKEAPTEDRKVFEELASVDKERFEQEKGNGSPAHLKGADILKKKRGPSAYMLFCAANRESIVDENGNKLPLGETTKRLSKIWNESDDDTKNAYVEQAQQHKAAMA